MKTWSRLKVTRGQKGDKGGNKGKGLVNKHVGMTHEPEQWCGNEWTVGAGFGLGRAGQRGENWDNCNRITIKKERGSLSYTLKP